MGRKDIHHVEREKNGIIFDIELATDTEAPKRNRFEFEGKKYAWIIRTPKPVPGPEEGLGPTTHELVLQVLEKVEKIEKKVEELAEPEPGPP